MSRNIASTITAADGLLEFLIAHSHAFEEKGVDVSLWITRVRKKRADLIASQDELPEHERVALVLENSAK